MAETSFPVVNQPLSADEWKTMALAWGDGIIDRGGWPYFMGSRDSVNDTVTITVDAYTNRNEAILSGFIHRVDTDKVLDLPPVAAPTTYEIGLVYDPLKHTEVGGPISLEAWTVPADYEGGKTRLVLYQVDRAPDVALANAPFREYRQRVAPTMVVTSEAHLPKAETMLTDTMAFVRSTSEWHRCQSNRDQPMQWVKVGDNSMLEAATYEAIGGTLMKRAGNGSVWAAEGTGELSVINKKWIADNATWAATGGMIAQRTGAGTLHVNTGSNSLDAANKGYVDGKKWSAGDVTSGQFSGDRIRHSSWAYNTAWGGSGTIRQVHVHSSYELCFYSSTIRHKTNVQPWAVDPRAALAVEPVEFDRLNPETGEETGTHDWGVIAEQGGEHLPMFVQYDDDGRVDGWDYFRWTTAHQVVLRYVDARVTALEARADAQDELIAEQAGHIDQLSDALSELLERVEKLEG